MNKAFLNKDLVKKKNSPAGNTAAVQHPPSAGFEMSAELVQISHDSDGSEVEHTTIYATWLPLL
jgi:hypothetical protein